MVLLEPVSSHLIRLSIDRGHMIICLKILTLRDQLFNAVLIRNGTL